MKYRTRLALPLLAIGLAAGLPAWSADAADSYPDKPIRMLLGYAAGSGADIVARLVANELQSRLKQSVVVENKPGASGVIAVQEVARTAPDGYTLLMAAMPQITIVPKISKAPYDVQKDFAPVSQVVGTDLVLATNPARVPSDSMQAFADWAKQQKSLFFGTPGPGTVGHFASYLVADSFRIEVEPVHYRTTGDQLTGLINGDIQAQFFSHAAALPLVKSGQLKTLITTGPGRSDMFPDTPSAREAGHPDLEFTSWYGVLAPAGTPPAIVDKLSAAIVQATQSEAMGQKLKEAGLRVTGTTPQAFAQVIEEDVNRWSEVVENSGFQPQP